MAVKDTLMIPMPAGARTYAYTQTGGAVDIKIVSSVPLHDVAQLVLDEDGSINVDMTGTGGGTTERKGTVRW